MYPHNNIALAIVPNFGLTFFLGGVLKVGR